MKSRNDTVFAKYTGRRPNRRIAMAGDFTVPKCLADIINGIGVFTIRNQAATVYPAPETANADSNLNLGAQVKTPVSLRTLWPVSH